MGDKKTSKVESLKVKRDQLNARIKNMEAADRNRQRKQETRRKILIGAYYLKQAVDGGSLPALYKTMQGFLSRESDKVLFAPSSKSAGKKNSSSERKSA